MHRQRQQVGVVAGEHDLLHRRLGARDLDDLRLAAQPALDLGRELCRRDAERAGEPRAAAGDVADQLLPLRAGRAKQHGARIAFERGRDVGEIERLGVRLDLVVPRQAFDEAAQPEAVEIRGACLRLFDDATGEAGMDSSNSAGKAAAARGPFIGRPMPRFEDLRLVRGAGRYTDDVSVPGQAYAVFVRAPHAHARIVRIDTAAARSRPGVLAVLTGADYVADGLVGMPHMPNPADANDVRVPTFVPTPERKILDEPQLPFAVERVRYVGEAVAIVVAETVMAARDAAEAVEVEYDVLPAVTDVEEALADAAPTLWPDAPNNLALDNAFGDRAAVEAAIAGAHLVVEQTIRNQRTASAFMEPRSAIGSYEEAADKYTLISGCQGVHRIRHPLAVASRCRRSRCT